MEGRLKSKAIKKQINADQKTFKEKKSVNRVSLRHVEQQDRQQFSNVPRLTHQWVYSQPALPHNTHIVRCAKEPKRCSAPQGLPETNTLLIHVSLGLTFCILHGALSGKATEERGRRWEIKCTWNLLEATEKISVSISFKKVFKREHSYHSYISSKMLWNKIL